MSINSLANSAAARRLDVGPINAVPETRAEIAAAAATPPENAPPDKQQAGSTTTAMNVLFGYIPTEILTFYVAVAGTLQPAATLGAGEGAAAAGVGAASAPMQSQWIAFGCFLVVTPLAVWATYANKVKEAGKALPLTYSSCPVWEMTAALLAFLAWAFALPGSPFREFSWYSPGIASLVVVLTSMILGWGAPFFQKPLQ